MSRASARELVALQGRLRSLLEGGFINTRAVEREAGVSNGRIKRIVEANPEVWANHSASDGRTLVALNTAVDKVVATVKLAE